jgi:uncharacterized membrane protein YkoI
MMRSWILPSVTAAALLMAAGCGSATKESTDRTVSLEELPAPARATVDRLFAQGRIEKIEQEEKDGSAVYDVEGTAGSRKVEYDIASDGKVLTSEQSIPYESVPAAVRMAAVLYFGSAEQMTASQETEDGKTFYEVQGRKDGHTVTIKLTDAGKIVGEEKK